MARKANKKNTRIATGPQAPGLAYSLGESAGRTLRPLLPLGLLALAYAALATVLWWPVKREPAATLDREDLLKPVLRTRERPPWIDAAQVRGIAALGLAAEGRSVFEPGLAADLSHAYATSPWVARVGAVRVRYPAAVQIEDPVWRVPFARVDCEGGHLVLDRDGFAMPLFAGDLAVPVRDEVRAGRMDLPSIVGVPCMRIGPGVQAAESQLRDGLALLDAFQTALRGVPGAPQTVRVRRATDGTWQAYLANGPLVEFGRWHDAERRLHEPTAREKTAALVRRLSETDLGRLATVRLDVPGAPVTLR